MNTIIFRQMFGDIFVKFSTRLNLEEHILAYVEGGINEGGLVLLGDRWVLAEVYALLNVILQSQWESSTAECCAACSPHSPE